MKPVERRFEGGRFEVAAFLFLLVVLGEGSVPPVWSAGEDDAEAVTQWGREEIERVLGSKWRRWRTPRFRVHVAPGVRLDHADLVELEEAFDDLSEALGLSEVARASFELFPLDYYHPASNHLVRRFTDIEADGVTFGTHRIVVSSRLPHEHELAHALVHARLHPLGSDGIPFLQEGLASWLGGLSGAAPRVVLSRGEAVLRRRAVDLRRLLTPAGFQSSSLDVRDRYAVAARFCDYFIAEYGLESLLDIYRRLARVGVVGVGPARFLALQFEGAAGRSWDHIEADFERWRAQDLPGGIHWGLPEVERPRRRWEEADHELRWWVAPDGAWRLAVSGPGPHLDFELLWGAPLDAPAAVDRGQPRWRQWGLRVGPTAIEIIDHRRRRRLAVLDGHLDWGVFPPGEAIALRVDPEVVAELDPPVSPSVFVMPRFEVGD